MDRLAEHIPLTEVTLPKSQRVQTLEHIPSEFRIESLVNEPKLVFQMPDDYWKKGIAVPVSRWTFAMYNKLLPAKANCRALWRLQEQYPKGVPLEIASKEISRLGSQLGKWLSSLDDRYGHTRDEILATAFPTSESDEKSNQRYGNQFVVSMNKNGQLSGMLYSFKFINFSGGRKPLVGLTGQGIEFARLKNPIMDMPPCGEHHRFSNDELDFLYRHISDNVPAEDFAYRTIIQYVSSGIKCRRR